MNRTPTGGYTCSRMSDGPRRCPRCRTEAAEGPPNCVQCGWDFTQAVPEETIVLEPPKRRETIILEPLPSEPAPAAAPAPAPPPAAPPPPGGGRRHSPAVALACGLLIPGAGQAYNGRPIRGFFVLFLTPLVIPWLLGLWGAWSTAKRMRAEGGRFGIGGVVWVLLQAWLFCNVGLAVLIGLTIAGVLR